ncbi:MAG: zinc-binding dehydrogenase [bacterium]|nr:zinc-binding dehydrogenase [bacterium]
MRRIMIHGPGGHERLVIEESQAPEPGPGEVLIEAEAIGVNYADCMVRMGLYKSAKDHVGWPICPGFEVAGKVAALGEGVADLRVGDPVVAVTRFFGYSTHLVVPENQAFPLPSSLTSGQAAGFPCVFLTAYYALRMLGNPRGGETMLVHSAAGGVGGALVQLGKVSGCRVVGVVGAAHKRDLVREHGASEVIDKSSEDLWAAAERHAPDGYHLIFDANGAVTLRQSYDHLAAPGKLIVFGFAGMLPKGRDRPNRLKLLYDWLRTPRFDPLHMTNNNRGVLGFNLSYLFAEIGLFHEAMAELLGWLEEGKIEPLPTRTFPFEDVAEAHRAIESGQTVGKLVLKV